METSDVIRRSKKILANHYGDRLASLVLYGSEARGEATAESDIDLLVLLNGPFDRLKELRTIVDLLYPVQLESDRLISARPASFDSSGWRNRGARGLVQLPGRGESLSS